jgi:tetratricopeptide (TPR) repeat protein
MLLLERVRDAEVALSRALQMFPDDSEFSQIEARLRTILKQNDRAVGALERAWKSNPRGTSVAVRLANAYSDRGDEGRSLGVLHEALTRDPDDKMAHLAIAKHLIMSDSREEDKIEAHLSRSFSKTDHNFDARFHYAQFLFYLRRGADALSAFQDLDRAAPPGFMSEAKKDGTLMSHRIGRISARVVRREATYLFVHTPIYPRDIYANERSTSPEFWDQLSVGTFATFTVTFNRQGPVAMGLRPEP